MSDDKGDLRSRMTAIEDQTVTASKLGSSSKMLGAAGIALIVCVGGYAVYDAVSGASDPDVGLPSRGVQDFPEDRGANDSLELPRPNDPVFVDREIVTTQTDSATLARLRELEIELAAARALAEARENETERERELREELQRERDKFAADISALRSSAQNDQQRAREILAAFQKQVSDLRQEIGKASSDAAKAKLEQQQAAAKELADAQAEFNRRLDAAKAIDPLEQERLRLEQERLITLRERQARLEAQRLEFEEQERQRANSGMVAVNNTGATEAGAGEGRGLSENEAFVRRVVEPVAIARASRITAPHATILQGTIIQASLETAVDSTLPGPIRGIVAEDVHSLDGSAVLVPAGSKVFGEYSSGIQLGQKRILIVWTRILTPSNRSISIASYGADQLGRSGTGGAVDTRFGTRFAGAAAISIIGAAPAIIASQSNNEATANAIEDVGNDFNGATGTALGQYLSLPPTIYVRQGSSVTIIVDRDLEIF